MIRTKLPTITFNEVAHVGELEQTNKKPGSYEGACLSVSMVPATWAKIARLGESGFILSGRGNFVDAMAIIPDQKQAIIKWAVKDGYLEPKDIVRLHYMDTETDEWYFTEISSLAAAEDEAREMDEEDYRFEHISTYVATEKLSQSAGYSNSNIDSSISFDLALIELASRDPDLDGIWWKEDFDPVSLSAPRGGIFPNRVADFTATHANWADLELFELQYLNKDALIFNSRRP